MQKKLTITIESEVYRNLHSKIGQRKISRFIENLVRPYVVGESMEKAYSEMAAEESREVDALEWAEGLAGEVADEPR